MSAHTTITPRRAADLVEAAGIENGEQIIGDHAAAGRVKSYALVIETTDALGSCSSVHGGAVPVELWKRIVRDNKVDAVWSRGTVHLLGSDLVGGDDAAVITGITFSPEHIDRLIAHHDGTLIAGRRKLKATLPALAVAHPVDQVDAASGLSGKRDALAIPPGALTATMEQTEAALSVSRGTVYNLIKRGKLVRVTGTGLRSVSIEVASIRAFAGLEKLPA